MNLTEYDNIKFKKKRIYAIKKYQNLKSINQRLLSLVYFIISHTL